jgi:hypothetical protein
MSKIALTPSATGTGVFTISSPATNTNRTLTLPDITGTLVSTNASGNVGIGTSSPAVALDVNGATNTQLRLTASDSLGASIINFGDQANAAQGRIIYSHINDSFSFKTNNVNDRLVINSSGAVLVGTTSSSYGGRIRIGNDGTATQASLNCINTLGSGTMRQIDFFTGSNTGRIGSIESTTSTTSFNTSSDYRLKTDAQPMTGASDRVLALKPVNFAWIVDGSRVDGFLAHEAQKIVPECVTGTKDAMRDEEYEVTAAVLDADGMVVTEAVMGTRSVPDYQGIDQSKLVPLLTAALQEALTEISALKVRVAALEAV